MKDPQCTSCGYSTYGCGLHADKIPTPVPDGSRSTTPTPASAPSASSTPTRPASAPPPESSVPVTLPSAPSSLNTLPLARALRFSDDWLTPLAVEHELLPVLPFDEGFLPHVIRPWVKDVAERMSLSLDYTASCALVTIAGVIGRRAFVYPKQFDKKWKESLALSGLVIAASGSRKTPCWKTFINPVFEIDINWRQEHSKEMDHYRDELEAWEEAQKQSKSDGDLFQPPKEPPPSRRCILSDATPEAMHAVMENNPEGILYFRDEMSSWVAELAKKDREVERGLFLAAMNGNDFYAVDRIGRGNVFAVMCASLFGGYQPALFRDFLSNTRNIDDGLIPRFTFLIWPDEHRRKLVDRGANEEAEKNFTHVLRTLSVLRAESIEMHFDADAQEAFSFWADRLEDKIGVESHTGMRSHLSKYAGAIARIAGVLQLVDLVSNGATPNRLKGVQTIDKPHFRIAENLMVYLESHMKRAYSCASTPLKAAEMALAKHLADGDLKDGFAFRDVARKCWRGLTDKDLVEMALHELEDKQWVKARSVTPKGGGWSTLKYEINPALSAKRKAA